MVNFRMASLLAACLFVMFVSANALADEPNGSSAPASTTVAEMTTVGTSTPFSACPSGTIEIEGLYCKTVSQRCLEGRDNIWAPPLKPGGLMRKVGERAVHCPATGCEVTPYFCDKFLEDSATCGTKTVADPDHPGKTMRVEDSVPMHFCIDDYEYPNVIGQMPRVMVSWNEAESLCEARGERLCRDDEWTLACEGPERLPYSYGWARDANVCNIDKPYIQPDNTKLFSKDPAVAAAELARVSQREPIGSMPACVSAYGAHDMTGNVDEWTRNRTHRGHPHISLLKGGHNVIGARNRCRPATDSHGPTFAFYAEGFRCCADAKKEPE